MPAAQRKVQQPFPGQFSVFTVRPVRGQSDLYFAPEKEQRRG